LKVATHSGMFHADEAMACAILQRVYRGDMEIVRTRDKSEIDRADIVVDVGGTYNPESNRYDHHKNDPKLIRPNGEPYSSAGLIWKHFGKGTIRLIQPDMNEDQIRRIWERIDTNLIRGIDAMDNKTDGINSKIPTLQFSAFISSLNSTWMEDKSSDVEFNRAVRLSGLALERALASTIGQILSESTVREALSSMRNGIVELERFVPWQEYVCENPSALFVVFESTNGVQWNAQCVPINPGSRQNRVPFPASWGGLSGLELEKATGIRGSVFCHKNLFMAVGKDKETVMKMVRRALERR